MAWPLTDLCVMQEEKMHAKLIALQVPQKLPLHHLHQD